METYDGKGGKSFIDWTTQIKIIAHSTPHPELHLSGTMAESIVYKLIEGMPQSSIWETVKRDYVRYLVWWQQKCMLLLEYILGLRMLMKLYKSTTKDLLIW